MIALRDSDWLVATKVEDVLANFGTIATDALLIALQDSDNDWYIRAKAAQILGRIGDSGSVEVLMTALGDSNEFVRNAASEALRRFRG